MNIKEIKKRVKSFGNKWYYYYNFGGIEVREKFRKDKTSGMYNWNKKIKPIVSELSNGFKSPCLFDIGCNMGMYAHMMTKMGIKVYAMDRNIKMAEFYSQYVVENLHEDWKVDLIQSDISESNISLLDVNIVTMFCVLYHISPNEDLVLDNLNNICPNHTYIVLQGNNPRLKRKPPQKIAGIKGMVELLENHNYETVVFNWKGYPKPVVVGKRKYE